jgi:ABC-type branched-subunit amino acid transport system ATPase component
LIIEQNIKLARTVADRFLILRDGKVAQVHDMRSGTVTEEEIVRSIYL